MAANTCSVLTRSTKRVVVLMLLMAGCVTANGEPEIRTCGGILHSDKYGLRFGRGPGEEEFICAINNADKRKVLATCSVGKYCEVAGLVEPCKDSGECIEIRNISSVRTKPRR